MTFAVGVFGASGYAGGELVKLVDAHPDVELAYLGAHTSAGERLGAVHPHLVGGDRVLGPLDSAATAELDLVFLALPHGASAVLAMEILDRGCRVVDLGSDFRLDGPERYREAYGSDHPFPDQLGAWAYGIPELFRDRIASADRTAAPGCYPTSAILALAPLLEGRLIDETRVVVDSMSGVTGAGRGAKAHLTFGAVDEGVTAYGVLTHRHRPEIEQGLEMASGVAPTVLFTPHLVPMQRGILSTCHAPLLPGVEAGDVEAAIAQAYAGEPFVAVVDRPPNTRWVTNSNRLLLHAVSDDRTGSALVFAAEDNLLKGAAGQAIQCANLMLGLNEAAGLPTAGWLP